MSKENEQLAVYINSILLRHRCLLSIETLSLELKSQTQVNIRDNDLLIKFLKKYPRYYSFRNIVLKGNTYLQVCAITDIKICQEHTKKNGNCDGECGSLHICKYFFLSGRCSFGERCSFGHDYRSRHNEQVFRAHLLDVKNIELEHLRFLVCQASCRNVTTMPQICTSKTCPNRNCKKLHMCKYFLESTCKFNDCKRNHSVQDPNVTNVLKHYGFNINKSPDEILQELREFFHKEITQNAGCLGHQPEHHRSAERCYLSDQYAMKYPDEREIDFQPEIRTTTTPTKSSAMSQPGRKQRNKKTRGKQPSVICIHNLRGKCYHGASCYSEHKSVIYQWQWKTDTDLEWTDFNEDNNIRIEKNFCQPDVFECFINMGDIVTKIDFDSMTGDEFMDGEDEILIRRLTTISSAIAPPYIQRWTTVWHWYWQDANGKWKEYGEPDINGWKADLNSDKIEREYRKNPEANIQFENESFKYVLSFTEMKQINSETNTERKVRRRTTYFHPQNTERRTVDDVADGHLKCAVPKEWKVTSKDVIEHYQVKQVDQQSQEFKEINRLFRETMSQNIETLERIENGELWSNYCHKKSVMKRKLGKEVEERQLFHGTTEENIQAICRQGFDFRFSGKAVGTLYGKGSYFANEASYSRCYTTCKKMFVAKILVGEFVKGNPSYVRPPPKDYSEPHGDLFDSCVDNTTDPKIFVVFDLSQVYPQYLITYS